MSDGSESSNSSGRRGIRRLVADISTGVNILRNDGPSRFYKSVRDRIRYHPPLFRERLLLRTWLARRRDPATADPFKVLFVDPAAITCVSRFKSRRDAGKILDGSWDLTDDRFEERTVYQGLRQRFVDGLEWTETAYYRRAQATIESNGRLYGCRSLEEFLDEQCAYLDDLYDSIRSNGYLPQSVLTSEDHPGHRRLASSAQRSFHEVTVSIGRDGELLFDSGNHRLSIAKILGIREIPVQVVVRHERWQAKRRQCYEDTNELPADLLEHPDLEDV